MTAKRFCKFASLKALRGVKMECSYFRVLVELWNYSDSEGGNAFPTIEKLAEDCSVSTSTVKRALKYLQDEGWVHQESRGRRGRGGVGWASVYSLSIPESTGQRWSDDESQQVAGQQSPGHPWSVNGSPAHVQQVTGEPPTDPLPDHATDQRTHPADDHRWVQDDDDGWGQALTRSQEDAAEPAADKNYCTFSAPIGIGADDEYCQWCEDSSVNVCGLHFHEREHRYREPDDNGRDKKIQPVSPSSMPTSIEPGKRCCRAEECDQSPIPLGRYCLQHLHLSAVSA